MDTTFVRDTLEAIYINPPEITIQPDQSSIVAVVISALFLIASIYWYRKMYKNNNDWNEKFLELNKEHNELSVKPILTIQTYLSEREKVFRIDLKNIGIGPCTIHELKFNCEDESFKDIFNVDRKSVV